MDIAKFLAVVGAADAPWAARGKKSAAAPAAMATVRTANCLRCMWTSGGGVMSGGNYAVTVIVPVIKVWMVHSKGYVPGLVKVKL
jgi:hypothetical protein